MYVFGDCLRGQFEPFNVMCLGLFEGPNKAIQCDVFVDCSRGQLEPFNVKSFLQNTDLYTEKRLLWRKNIACVDWWVLCTHWISDVNYLLLCIVDNNPLI